MIILLTFIQKRGHLYKWFTAVFKARYMYLCGFAFCLAQQNLIGKGTEKQLYMYTIDKPFEKQLYKHSCRWVIWTIIAYTCIKANLPCRKLCQMLGIHKQVWVNTPKGNILNTMHHILYTMHTCTYTHVHIVLFKMRPVSNVWGFHQRQLRHCT